jgi:hypothetical protein
MWERKFVEYNIWLKTCYKGESVHWLFFLKIFLAVSKVLL